MTSPFIPTYREFPVEDSHNLQKQLVNSYVQVSNAVNNKTIGNFATNQVPNGERWFPAPGQQRLRDGQRIVLEFTSILNGTTTIPHGIRWTKITRFYGTADNGTTGIPLEHSTSTEVISLSIDQTNVYINTTTANWTSYSGFIVVEFFG